MVRSEPLPRIPSVRRVRQLARCAAIALALQALVLGPVGSAAATAQPGGAGPAVILISMDGTTPEAVGAAGVESLAELARRGAAARRLTPVFPTNTFPNHVTLVTGVAPEVHGIVNNVFLDPERGLFSASADPTWIEVEPIWSIASRHGVVSASFHWVGSEGPWRRGRGPRHWRAFDYGTPEAEKVEQILAWLDLADPRDRPRLVTAWFRGGDRAGHRHGPGSAEVLGALRTQGRALARLVAGLDERGAFATTTLLVVSDHGMAQVERRVQLDLELRRQGIPARVLGAGGFATLSVRGGREEAARAIAAARGLGLEAYPREEAPPELRLGHPRFGPVVVLAPVGTAIESSALPSMEGAHGYRSGEASMGALFVVAGRGVRPGTRLGEVRALDVAPTVLALLGIPAPEWMEGRPIPGVVAAEAAGEERRSPSAQTGGSR